MRAVAASIAVIASAVVASGCASSGKKPTTSVRNSASGPAGAGALTQREIHVARASDRLLSIFPAVPGKRRCSFPEGGTRIIVPEGGTHITPHGIHGMCSTNIRLRHDYGEPSWVVTFTQRWRRPECAPDLAVYCSHPIANSRWEIVEGETPTNSIRVLTTRISGATPPQLYK